MPRIPYPEFDRLSETSRAIIGEKPNNVALMLAAASEPVLAAIHEVGNAFIYGSPLPGRLREIAILRVGYLSNAPYEIFQHEAAARHAGLTEEQISAIREGGAAGALLGEAGAAVLAFVDDLVINVRPSDATLEGVRAHLGDTQVVDLTLVTGNYMMICRFLETTGVEIDPQPIDWSGQAARRSGG